MSKRVDQLTPEELAAKREYDRQYNSTKRDRRSAAQKTSERKYREANWEARRMADRVYSAMHSDQRTKSAQAWRDKNRSRWRLRHRADFHRRKARLLASWGTWSAEQFQAMCEAQNWTCSYCGKSTRQLQPDHMTPLARGGSNDLRNITPACERCNYRKSDKTADEFRVWAGQFGYGAAIGQTGA